MLEKPSTMAPRQAFDQAVKLLMAGRHDEAAPYAVAAAEAGHGEAQNLLGVMYMNAMGIDRDLKRAVALFDAGSAAGIRESHYNLANLLFNGMGVSRDDARAQRHLMTAARAGHAPSLRSLGYLYHLMGAAGEWPVLATRCFCAAATRGDALASYALGMRLWKGLGMDTDLAAARDLLTAAASRNVYMAPSRLAELSAVTGPLGEQALRPMQQDASIPELIEFQFPVVSCPSPSREHALVAEYDDAVDPIACDHVINVMAPYMRPSEVIDPETGAPMRNLHRTSHSGYMIPSLYDAVVSRIWHDLSMIAGLPHFHAEPVEVLRYSPGQEYKLHYDSFGEGQRDGKRAVTTFVYLSDVLEGGGTAFPKLDWVVQPRRGRVVRFLNHLPSGEPDRDSLHAGLPVIRGEKWLANLWFWDRPFDCYQ